MSVLARLRTSVSASRSRGSPTSAYNCLILHIASSNWSLKSNVNHRGPSDPGESGNISHRRISTSASAPSKEFMIQIPDVPNSSENRARVSADHMKQVEPLVGAGRLTLGSAWLKEHPRTGEKPFVVGSFVILKAENEDAVRNFLEEDVYTKEGVWDAKNAKIWPIVTGIQTAL